MPCHQLDQYCIKIITIPYSSACHPSVYSHYHCSSFFVSSIPLWNSLPESLVGLFSHLDFKRHLKHSLQV